jgi:putative inorganic carbon (HCO3(-)) transporter
MGRSIAANQAGAAVAHRLPVVSIPSIWRAFWSEPLSFKLTCIYVFFEYVRPQQVYPSLQFLPWAQISIVAACAAFVAEGFRVRSKTVANTWLFVFAVLIVLSSIFATDPGISFSRLNTIVNWLIAFFLVANTTTDQRKFFLFLVLYLLWSAKMSQFGARAFVLRGGTASGAPGWFQNTGEFALQMCIFVPLSLQFIIGLYPALSKRTVAVLALLPLTGVASILGSGSRGGLLGLAVVGLWMLLASRHKVRGLVALAVVTPLIWFAVPDYQKARINQSGSDNTSISRLVYWKNGIKMANSHPILGVGYENWVPYYRLNFPPDPNGPIRYNDKGEVVTEVSHNSFVEVVSQLGYPALFVFLALLATTWMLNAKSRRILAVVGERGRFLRQISYGLDAGVAGFIAAGFFMAVAFYPFVWFQLAMAAALNLAAVHTVAAIDGPILASPTPARGPEWRSRRRLVRTA